MGILDIFKRKRKEEAKLSSYYRDRKEKLTKEEAEREIEEELYEKGENKWKS